MHKGKQQKGFTMAELLIVVAIIAVLVAIGIPVFSSQLEKSREATDLANVRAAYAELMTAAITEEPSSYEDNIVVNNKIYEITVPLKQRAGGWSISKPIQVGGVTSGADGGNNADGTWRNLPKDGGGGVCTISYNLTTDQLVFDWNGNNIATHVDFKAGCWNGAGESNTKPGKMISTLNPDRADGFYELKGGEEYKISFTYDPKADDLDNPSKAIIARAMLLYDSNGRNVFDSGSGAFNLNQENTLLGKIHTYQNGQRKDTVNKDTSIGVTYKYTKNNDGTLTYTATLKTLKNEEKYYFGMNFGGREIQSDGSTKGDLEFKTLGTNAEADLKAQIKNSFSVERVK